METKPKSNAIIIKEKIKKIYQKNNIIVTDKIIGVIMQDKKNNRRIIETVQARRNREYELYIWKRQR